MKTQITLSLAAFALAACSKSSFRENQIDSNVGSLANEVSSQCVSEAADYQIETEVLGFEMTSSGSVKVGFGVGGFLKAIDLGVSYESGRMTTAMTLTEPLHTGTSVAQEMGEGKKTGIKLGMSFLSNFLAGFEVYHTTSPGTLSERSIEDNWKNLNFAWMGRKKAWRGFVLKDFGANEVLMSRGSVSGVQVGDEFEVYDAAFEWKGRPCESDLQLIRQKSKGPLAQGRVTQIDLDSSILSLDQKTMGQIPVGSIILPKIQKDPKLKKNYRFSMQIKSVKSPLLQFQFKDQIHNLDLTPYLREQLKRTLGASKTSEFYLRN